MDALLDQKVLSAVRELWTDLEAGASGSLIACLETMSQFHDYSFSNVMLIRDQRPNATRIAGRRTWATLGRRVLPQAQGIVIQVPILPRWMYRLPPAKKDPNAPCSGFREGNVYDVADTDGKQLPMIPTVTGNPGRYLSRIKAAIERDRVALRLVPSFDGTYDGQTGNRRGLPPAEEFQTLAHRYSHGLLHQRKLDRPQLKAVVETEAEAAAFIVGRAVGLEIGMATRDYTGLHQADIQLLRGSLSRIQRTAKYILRQL